MIDLHCHLLPGIDDGPATMEESLELCRMAVADGIAHAIVTPHIHPGRWENTRQSIERDCVALQHALDEHSIPLKLGFAGEVRLTDQIIQQVENDDIPFYGELNGYRIMLLEFPHGHIIPGSENLVEWLLAQKIRPLIAHPERNREVMISPQKIIPFVVSGCLLQLTAGSICGDFGKKVQEVSDKLLRDDLVSVIASDGHNNRARQPVLRRVFKKIVEDLGEEMANSLLKRKPGEIVADQFTGLEVIA